MDSTQNDLNQSENQEELILQEDLDKLNAIDLYANKIIQTE